MSLRKALKNVVTAFGGSSDATTLAGLLDDLALAKDPLFGLTIDTVIGADTDLLGKVVGDLQSDIVIHEDKITGTLKYIDDYTGFSGNPDQQEGYFIAIHCSVPDVEGVTITVKNTQTVTLDADGIYVGILGDPAEQELVITASKDDYPSVSKTLKLYTLTLEAPEED